MELKMASCMVILLGSLMFVDARYSKGPEIIPGGDYRCNSCLEASRKAERTLKEKKFLKEFHMLSSEVCHVLPINFETQCLVKSQLQIHQSKLFLQDLFHEKSLCNSTGLCTGQPVIQDEVEIIVENKMPLELEDEIGCIACQGAVRELQMKIKQPKTKKKIIGVLVDYCEEAEYNEKQCKQIIYKYVPTVLIKLEQLKPNDMCFMMAMCDEGPA